MINVDCIDEFRLSQQFNADVDSFYSLIYVVCSMMMKRNKPKILMDLHVLSTPEYEKVSFEIAFVCRYKCAPH
jgi:hypothetical protein